jgi:hypothetical protein
MSQRITVNLVKETLLGKDWFRYHAKFNAADVGDPESPIPIPRYVVGEIQRPDVPLQLYKDNFLYALNVELKRYGVTKTEIVFT